MIIPKFRKFLYSIYRACERFGIKPPNIHTEWANNSSWQQALLLSYSEVRQGEEGEELTALIKSNYGSRI